MSARLKRGNEPVRKKKQDTPQKTLLRRRIDLKQMRAKMYETLPERVEVNFPPVQKVLPKLMKETELYTRADGSEDASPHNLVIDTSSSYENEDSSVCDSSSCPSPEVFREDHYVEQWTFHLDDEMTDLHFPIKNSTLLERSNAETILTYQPPNLSAIQDVSTILAENTYQNINQGMRSSSEGCKYITGPTSGKACETSAVTQFKKRVWFRSPLFSEKSRRDSITTPKRTIQGDKIIHKQVFPSSPHKNIEPEAETLQLSENDDVDGGTFFNFACDSEHDSYIHKMRERWTKLKNAALFPLSVKLRESSVSKIIKDN